MSTYDPDLLLEQTLFELTVTQPEESDLLEIAKFLEGLETLAFVAIGELSFAFDAVSKNPLPKMGMAISQHIGNRWNAFSLSLIAVEETQPGRRKQKVVLDRRILVDGNPPTEDTYPRAITLAGLQIKSPMTLIGECAALVIVFAILISEAELSFDRDENEFKIRGKFRSMSRVLTTIKDRLANNNHVKRTLIQAAERLAAALREEGEN